jgi:sterol desaturase/sphingolipid hydroxylase (fatty acid hydroxylase superfamily)
LDRNVFYGLIALLVLYIGFHVGLANVWTVFLFPVLGLFGWTFVEYAIHRWLFHGILAPQHALHHAAPTAYIGAPNYVSIGSYGAVAIVLALFLPLLVVAELSIGMIVGYLTYLRMHDLVHHEQGIMPVALDMFRRHHEFHHRAAGFNFGITTRLWDHLLGTQGLT